MSSDRKTRGEAGLQIRVCEGGSGLCGSQCKCTARCTDAFRLPAAYNRQAEPRPRAHSERQTRRKQNRWRGKRVWVKWWRETADRFLSLFFLTLWGALATISDQATFYWSILETTWLLGPISRFWCSTKSGRILHSRKLFIVAPWWLIGATYPIWTGQWCQWNTVTQNWYIVEDMQCGYVKST